MYQAELAKNISNQLLRNGLLQKDDIAVMTYYLENIMSFFEVIGSISIIAFWTRTLPESIIYLVAFFLGRSCCGGYHAKSHLRCYLLSMGTYLLFLLFTELYCQFGQPITVIVILVLDTNILLILFAPTDSSNKRFTAKERQCYRKKSMVLLLLHNVLFILAVQSDLNVYWFAFFYGMFQLAFSVMMVK